MRKPRSRRGETLIESLISLLMIGMLTGILTMTIATVARRYVIKERTDNFFNEAAEDMETLENYTLYVEKETADAQQTEQPMEDFKVTVKGRGGMYCYEVDDSTDAEPEP